MWKSWTNALLGLWLISAAFLGLASSINIWNDFLVGAAVTVISLRIMKDRAWQGWLAVVFGAWIIFTAFVPSLTGGIGCIYNDLISGLIITVTGFASMVRRDGESLA